MAGIESQPVIQTLKTALGALDLPSTDSLRQDVLQICDRLQNPNLRVAVFGPFNYGKSTLLNALLGDKTLPMDLIPTTGAAILVRYGETVHTIITLANGQCVEAEGTRILQDYAVLDEQRRMRGDVAAVEVTYPHEFLKTGVEFLDLPGTDDQQAQNDLVEGQLLTASVVIQLLDARKLMTLGEREHLRDWLLNRGLETVVFVVNFVNLLEPDDQKQVMNRMRFVAESFRAKLPPGVSNLYRVDALPALRACLKGDRALAESSGLPTFETALQTIAASLSDAHGSPQLSQLQPLLQRLRLALQAKVQQLSATIEAEIYAKQNQKLQVQKKAQTLLNQGFLESVQEISAWATPQKLLQHYGRSLTLALIENQYETWLYHSLKKDWQIHKDKLWNWVKKAADFFKAPPPPILIVQFPSQPVVRLPEAPASASPKRLEEDAAPVAIATGLGWLMGGPIGAAVMGGVSYVFTQQADRIVASSSDASDSPKVAFDLAYAEAAEAYLRQFSHAVQTAIAQYQIQTYELLNPVLQSDLSDKAKPQAHHQLSLLESLLGQIDALLAR